MDNCRICCKNIPVVFFEDKNLVKNHFRQFGPIKKIVFKAKSRSCTIEFVTPQAALTAMDFGGTFHGQTFKIIKEQVPKRVVKDKDPEWIPDPDVLEELNAMGGGPSPELAKRYNFRPEVMDVSVAPEPPSIKQIKRRWPLGEKKTSPKKRKVPLVGLSKEQLEWIDLITKPVREIEEQYKVLDARDKLLRSFLKKGDSRIGPTQGTCPDMCPQKERLLRQIEHQVSIFEQDQTKKMNQKLAVKRYSRSSADQEASLPHELRPVAVLQMTMSYLIHRIANLGDSDDVNIGEWFHFLWDRTRGIRKDITQQALCSRGAVELVERCARFHIHCSARLVAEEPSVFDQKINTENLTKCLQTLKYMYDDLLLKGEQCPNEAEFRAYVILLNLNDGNFMWEFRRLRVEIQKSAEVRKAMELYSALNKNNFVRFFKIVKSSNYLTACILMRYFVQVRVNAIATLLHCYNTPRHFKVTYPLDKLTEILGFENDADTREFLQNCCLPTNDEKTAVVLDKNAYVAPDITYTSLDRSINLIESKRAGRTLGEVICGGVLPSDDFNKHEPRNDFDERGKLKLSEFFDQKTLGMMMQKEATPEKVKKNPFVYVKDEKQDDATAHIAVKSSIFTIGKETAKLDNIFGGKTEALAVETVLERKSSVAEPKVNTLPIFTTAPPVKTTETEQKEIANFFFAPPVPPKTDDEETKRRERQRIEEEALKQQKQREELERQKQLLREKEIAEEKRRLEEQRLKYLREEKEKERLQRAEKEKKRLREIKEVVGELIPELVERVAIKVRNDKLAEFKDKRQTRILSETFRTWMEVAKKLKKERSATECNSFWSRPWQPVVNQSQLLTLVDMKRYKSGRASVDEAPADEPPKRIDLGRLSKTLVERYNRLGLKFFKNLYWKCVVSFCDSQRIDEILSKILPMHLSKFDLNSVQTVNYCFEKRRGRPQNVTFDGNGLVFVAKQLDSDLRERILQSLRYFGVFVRVPIAVIVERLSERTIDFKALIKEGIISDYLLIVDDFSPQKFSVNLEKSLIFLAENADRPPVVLLDTLKSLLDKHLCAEIWKRAASYARWNSSYENCLKEPNVAVALYNEALDKLKKILLDERSYEMSTFPNEFRELLPSNIPDYLPCDYRYFPQFSNSATYLSHLSKIMDTFKLKRLKHWPPSGEHQLAVTLREYCSDLFKNPEVPFLKIWAIFSKKLEANCYISDVIWIDIIAILAAEKMKETDFTLDNKKFTTNSIFNQLVVLYDKEALDNYEKSDWFYVENQIVKNHIARHEIQPLVRYRTNVLNPKEEQQIVDKLVAVTREQMTKYSCDKAKKELEEFNELLSDLEESIGIEKKISLTLNDILMNAVGI